MKRFRLLPAVLALGLLSAPATATASPFGGEILPAHEKAFNCVSDVAEPDAAKTVLLVHGVGTDSVGTYSWNYQNSLRQEGFDVCTVDLPSSGRADLIESAEYVASAIKLAHYRLDAPVAVMGHSGGPTATLWALRYDADAASKVDDFVSLAGALHGTTFVGAICEVLGECPAIGWQMTVGSNFMKAVHAQPLPENISVTSVYSRTDYGIQPANSVSRLEGASNIAVQDVCATKLPGHIGILADSAAQALVIDALDHDGPADPSRISPEVCSAPVASGLNVWKSVRLLGSLVEYIRILTEPRVASEPALPEYAMKDLEDNQESYEYDSLGSSEGIAGSSENFATGISDAVSSVTSSS